MRIVVLFAVCSVLLAAVPATAQQPSSSAPLLEQALSRAAFLQPELGRERSTARTWIGAVMATFGGLSMIGAAASDCADNKVLAALADVPTCGQLWGVFGLGAGLTVSGVLLATIWSDVPVARDLNFAAAPGRVTVGRTFGF